MPKRHFLRKGMAIMTTGFLQLAKFAATSAFLLAASIGAQAAPITGSGDPLMNASLAGGTQEGFDSTSPDDYSTITIGNVQYSGIGDPLTIGPDFNGDYNTSGGQSILNGFDETPSQFRFDFLTSVSNFAFNFGASDNKWLLEAFDASNNRIDSLLIPAVLDSNVGNYFGISSTVVIAYALLTDQKDVIREGDFVFIDRFTTNGAVSAVPVPAALPLLMTGLAVFGAVSRRRRKVGA
jgi:hypothetical protein